jgi:class 3 adenylate cyclase
MPGFQLLPRPGDTVNTTSRMESTGVSGAIHASAAAHALLPDEDWIPTEAVEVKGLGLMQVGSGGGRRLTRGAAWAPTPHVNLKR